MSQIRTQLAPVLAAVIAAAFSSHVAAQPIGSSYSSTMAANCWGTRGEKNVDDNTTRVCRGKVGLVVLVNQDDPRQTISIGRDKVAAGNEPAATTKLGPLSSAVRTIEWRMAGSEPFAIIQHWRIADNNDAGNDKPMLVVTRLPPGPVCHVAYVDVAANPNADELARKAADELARDFKCGKDTVKVIGAKGRAVELAMQR
jgi:hypothetical protein